MKKKAICKNCGKFGEIIAWGLCQRCYGKKYYLENKKKHKAANRKCYIEHREERRAASRRYYAENSEKIKKYCLENKEAKSVAHRKWYLKNKEKQKAARRKYYTENPEKIKAGSKKYYTKNLEKIKAYQKKYYTENPEKQKEYYHKNPGKFRDYHLKRRGYGFPKKGVVDRVINENIFKYGAITCEQCLELCLNKFHLDHIIPVSRGGSNDYNNLQILCAKHNQEKHTKTMDYRQISKNNQMFLKTSGG